MVSGISQTELRTRDGSQKYFTFVRTSSEENSLQARARPLVDDEGRTEFNFEQSHRPKLVWAIFKPGRWWPALLYPSVDAFETNICPQLRDRDGKSYEEICKHLAAIKYLNKKSKCEPVVFLGRSILDFRIVRNRENTIQRFGGENFETIARTTMCMPEAFSFNKREYVAFHNGLDEAMCLIAKKSDKSSLLNANWRNRAEQAWKDQSIAVVSPPSSPESKKATSHLKYELG